MKVVDASVALKWFVTEENSPAAIDLARSSLAAPSLILSEIANGLWKKHRRGEITTERALAAIIALPRFLNQIVPADGLAARALQLAIELDHPAYDCFYLALAEALSSQFVTADTRMINKLRGTAFAARVQSLT